MVIRMGVMMMITEMIISVVNDDGDGDSNLGDAGHHKDSGFCVNDNDDIRGAAMLIDLADDRG